MLGRIWEMHPGDLVITEVIEETKLQVLHCTPNDLECQRVLNDHSAPGRRLIVFRVQGSTE